MAVPDSPSDALAARVQAVVGELRPRERTALELCDREQVPYAEIASELELRREGVADLLVTARLAVEAGLRDGPVPERPSSDCGPSRRVLVAQQDGEPVSGADLERARSHVSGCAACQEARTGLVEAGLACRVWGEASPEQLREAMVAPQPVARRAPARASAAEVVRRNRAATAAVVALALVAIVLALAGGSGGDSAPKPINPPPQGSADAPGRDVVPPPGDQFCASGEPGCP